MSIDWTYWPSDSVWSSAWDWRPPWLRPARPGTMRWALERTTGPTVEPVTLADAKAHLRVTFSDDDGLISAIITAARDYVERTTGRVLLGQTWKLWLDRFPSQGAWEMWPWTAPPGTILIPLSPVQSVTSLQWVDANGIATTVDPIVYVKDLISRFPRVALATGQNWPSTPNLAHQNGIVLTFVAGYPSTDLLPPTLHRALLLMIGHWYANRESVVIDSRVAALEVPQAAKALLALHQPMLVG